MNHHNPFVSLALLAALAATPQAADAQDPVMGDAAAPVAAASQPPQRTLKGDVPTQPDTALPSTSAPATVFREIPSISGRYSFGGKTLMPYLGAGFSGGYTSDLNRTLGSPLPAQTDSGLRSQFGQGLSLNEFQMGLRIPF